MANLRDRQGAGTLQYSSSLAVGRGGSLGRGGVALGVRRLFGDGIVAAGVERVTAQNSPRGEPATAPRTEPLDRLDRVLGAGGLIATGRGKQWRDGEAVEPHDRQ